MIDPPVVRACTHTAQTGLDTYVSSLVSTRTLKKFLSLLMALALAVSLVPTIAWADEPAADAPVAATTVPGEVAAEPAAEATAAAAPEPATAPSAPEPAAPVEPTAAPSTPEPAAPAPTAAPEPTAAFKPAEPATATPAPASPASEPAEPAAEPAAETPTPESATPTADETRLAEALAALEKDGWNGYYPVPVYGRDTNLNAMMQARLTDLGFAGVSSRVVEAPLSATDPQQVGAIDTSAQPSNGTITYFFLSPDAKTVSFDYGVLRQFKPTYTLTLGEASTSYTPGRTSSLAWDDALVRSYLEDQASRVSLDENIKAGTVAESITTTDMPVETRIDSTKTASIAWSSSDSSVARIKNGFDASYQPTTSVQFTHAAVARTVVLTATYTLQVPGYGNAPQATYEVSYEIAVDRRAAATVEQTEKQLARILSKATALDAASSTAPRTTELDADLRFSTPRSLGIDGKVYKLSYASDNEQALVVNGYRGVVTRPLEGEGDRQATVTATLTYEGVSVSRQVGTYTLKPVASDEISRAVALMDKVEHAYGQALLGENASAEKVHANLDTFMEASESTDGSLVWARSVAEKTNRGIVPDDLPGYDPMVGQSWRTFRSSASSVVEDEILRVNRPAYDRRVTVDSVLTYRAYESLAAAHPQHKDLQSLVKRPVRADFVVQGTKGKIDPNPSDQLSVTCSVIGADSAGAAQIWAADATLDMPLDSTAADLSKKFFEKANLSYAAAGQGVGWYLTTITSPYDKNQTLGWDEATKKFWQLFINGTPAKTGAGGYVLQAGDRIVWYYSADKETLPVPGDIVINPDAPRPSYESSWPGFANGMSGSVVSAPTPTESAELAWSYHFQEDGAFASASDPLIVNGRLYLVVAGELRMINAQTAAVEHRAPVGSTSAYFNRPVYTDGVIIVPSDNGSLTAFTADTLTCVWKTAPLEASDGSSFQSLSSLSVADQHVFAGFSVVGRGGATDRGSLVCVDVRDGRVVWTKDERAAAGSSMGYYWAGAAVSGSDIVIGDDAGRVRLIGGSSGEVLSSVDVGAPVRAGVIAVPKAGAQDSRDTFVVVTSDGRLHKLDRAGTVLSVVGSVSFAAKSTSTPAVAAGKVFVGAVDADGYGTLSIIDVETMRVERSVKGGLGEAQGSPLVSVQGDNTYVYFTCNSRPGGVYGYRLGDEAAYQLYTPPAELQQYSTSSIIADEKGNLYYTNDSGTLFALKGVKRAPVTGETDGDAGAGSQPGSGTADTAGVAGAPAGAVGRGGVAPREAASFVRSWARTSASGTTSASVAPPARTGSDGASAAKAAAGASDKGTDAATSEREDDTARSELPGVNLWAAGGLALGVMGFVGAGVYLAAVRRRAGRDL